MTGGRNNIWMGTVLKNFDDKDKEGRGLITVRFPGLEDGKDTVRRVRVMQPYASGKQGFFFTPEVGDTVLVIFLGAGMSRGVAIGSVYHAKDEGRLADKDNNTKEISTRSGLSLTLSDHKKKEAITIATPKKQSIRLDDEAEQITLSSGDKTHIRANGKKGELTAEAPETIRLVCGSASIELRKNGDILIKGGKVTVEGRETEVKASAKLALSGQSLSAKAKTAAALEGGTKTEVKSSGITEIKGSMVKLNG